MGFGFRIDVGRAGTGRSSVIAAAMLLRFGVREDEVWQTITSARGVTVPETDEQRARIHRYATRLIP